MITVVEEIESLLRHSLHPAQLRVYDDSAAHAGHAGAREGGHYRVDICAERFRNVSLLQRHRLVYTAVAGLLKGKVHALSINATVPKEP
ncbi:MAG: BolA/IbaG family iron-sulfur metabolism protein [Pseudomonadota bacterium]